MRQRRHCCHGCRRHRPACGRQAGTTPWPSALANKLCVPSPLTTLLLMYSLVHLPAACHYINMTALNGIMILYPSAPIGVAIIFRGLPPTVNVSATNPRQNLFSVHCHVRFFHFETVTYLVLSTTAELRKAVPAVFKISRGLLMSDHKNNETFCPLRLHILWCVLWCLL